MKIRIESPVDKDGAISSQGTRVFALDDRNGLAELKGITSLTVNYPINGVVSATIECMVSPHTIEANAILSFRCLKEAAGHYGYDLVAAEKTQKIWGGEGNEK